MNREEITRLLAEYEKDHGIDKYVVHDIHIWPIIRISIAFDLHREHSSRTFYNQSHTRLFEKSSSLLKRTRDKYLVIRNFTKSIPQHLKVLFQYTTNQNQSPTLPNDITIITYSNRLIRLDNKAYNTIADPFAEQLSNHKTSHLIWECGQSNANNKTNTSRMSNLLQIKTSYLFYRLPDITMEPLWFKEISDWASRKMDVELDWYHFYQKIKKIMTYSHIFEQWLRKAKCKLVVTDCWYNLESMAAILAAYRLGIHSIDYQHGLQGAGHFAYQSWIKSPPNGYEVMPDRFWVWGHDDANNLRKNNPNIANKNKIMVGGNLWINNWTSSTFFPNQRERINLLAKDYDRVITVTLQKGIHLETILIETIKQCSNNWLWFIRVHRNDLDKISSTEKIYRSIENESINTQQASTAPLYTLFHVTDTHLTGFSSCALEALSFGVPTVLIHPSGQAIYSKYINNGVMYYADRPKKIAGAITNAFSIKKENCIKMSKSVFADEHTSEKAINILVNLTAVQNKSI